MSNFRFKRDSRSHAADLIRHKRSFHFTEIPFLPGRRDVDVEISELEEFEGREPAVYDVRITVAAKSGDAGFNEEPRVSRVRADSRQQAEIEPFWDHSLYVEPVEGENWGSVANKEQLSVSMIFDDGSDPEGPSTWP